MKRTLFYILGALVLGVPGTGAAQDHPVLGPSVATGRLWAAPPDVSSRSAENGGILGDGSHDHRYRGFWIGAGLGLGFSYLGYQFCKDTDTSCDASAGKVMLRSALVIGMLGTVGALIGAQVDR